MDRYDDLPTEQSNPAYPRLDTLGADQLVAAINRLDHDALEAVAGAFDAIARGVDLVRRSLAAGGRLLYVGAGTSGRLGLLDAAECPPTFGTLPQQVVGVMAGGAAALERAQEGAEDSSAAGRAALDAMGVGCPDIVCGISASGVTPFVRGALRLARQRRCPTMIVTCAAGQQAAQWQRSVDLVVSLPVGPELIAGSTRMKAGLATKAVLHTLTTAAMIRLGKVYDNLMIDVRPTSRKLRRRAVRIVIQLTGLDRRRAGLLLRRAGDSPKVAVVMSRRSVGRDEAERLLREADGFLRPVVETPGR